MENFSAHDRHALAELIIDGSAALDAALAFDTLVRIDQGTADGVAALVPMATFMVEKYWVQIDAVARALCRTRRLDFSDVVGLVGGSGRTQPL